ncbi:MAG: hypothetical protein R3C45_02070 [Phycisphaerales bacterium]
MTVTGMVFDDFSKMQFTSARLTYGEVGKAAFQLTQTTSTTAEHPRRILTSPQWIDGQSTAAFRDPS